MRYPDAINKLINKLSELPSVGPKTAERYVFYLLKQSQEGLEELASSIKELKEKTVICQDCRVIADASPCRICNDSNREKTVLCLVENTQDLSAIEATNQFKGHYFVLGGLISTIKEIGPESLEFRRLLKKIETDKIEELIIALNFSLEGETTALYLKRLLKDKIKISRLAKGLPAGSDLEYADELTLASALKNRNKLK